MHTKTNRNEDPAMTMTHERNHGVKMRSHSLQSRHERQQKPTKEDTQRPIQDDEQETTRHLTSQGTHKLMTQITENCVKPFSLSRVLVASTTAALPRNTLALYSEISKHLCPAGALSVHSRQTTAQSRRRECGNNVHHGITCFNSRGRNKKEDSFKQIDGMSSDVLSWTPSLC